MMLIKTGSKPHELVLHMDKVHLTVHLFDYPQIQNSSIDGFCTMLPLPLIPCSYNFSAQVGFLWCARELYLRLSTSDA